MGRRIGELASSEEETMSLSESLLFATMCIVGLPVDVHVKNGSVFSGIFHAASVEGVCLKKARMIKKGRSSSNVADGHMIETLVILSDDLVQVIAKGAVLPAEGVAVTIAGDESESALGTASFQDVARTGDKSGAISTSKKRPYQGRTAVQSENGLSDGDKGGNPKLSLQRETENENDGKRMSVDTVESINEEIEKSGTTIHFMVEEASSASANGRQVEDDRPKMKKDDSNRRPEFHGEDNASAIQGSPSSFNSCLSQVKPVDGTHLELMPSSEPKEASHHTASGLVKSDIDTCCRPHPSDSAVHAASPCVSASTPSGCAPSNESRGFMSSVADKVNSQGLEANRRAKESKLNPGAKIFSPALANPMSASPPLIQTVSGMSYPPSASPMLPVAAAQTEVGIGPFVPQSAMPAKVMQYNNLTAGNGDMGALSQSFVGNIGSRTQLLRYGGHHHALPVGSNYVHPISQAVMVGRMGQLVYMPVSQDPVQSATTISPALPRPLPTISQLQFPKHQGTLPGQAFVHQPMVGGQQLYAAASPAPLLPSPFLANRPISVPGSNGFFHTKF